MPHTTKSSINVRQQRYGIRKYQFEALDDIDLLCEINIYSCCLHQPGLCVFCRKFLTWCLEILQKRWDLNKYIDFHEALKIVKDNRILFDRFLGIHNLRKSFLIHLISKK